MSKSEHLLDARGLVCPEPIHEAERAIRALPPGACLKVLATDLAAPIDFEAWCFHQGHRYAGALERTDCLEIKVFKAQSPTPA
jgi:tRNA 2-thiouridine synthesizing protein A